MLWSSCCAWESMQSCSLYAYLTAPALCCRLSSDDLALYIHHCMTILHCTVMSIGYKPFSAAPLRAIPSMKGSSARLYHSTYFWTTACSPCCIQAVVRQLCTLVCLNTFLSGANAAHQQHFFCLRSSMLLSCMIGDFLTAW